MEPAHKSMPLRQIIDAKLMFFEQTVSFSTGRKPWGWQFFVLKKEKSE
jgi:hypothetical protein